MTGLLVVAVLVVVALVVLGAVTVSSHLLTWVLVGLVAGALAGRLVRGRGMGLLMDIPVGLGGALIGGLLVNLVHPSGLAVGGIAGLLEDVVIAFIGAVILLVVIRIATPRRHRLTKANLKRSIGR